MRVRVAVTLVKKKKEVISPTLTIKVVGHQWFWSYELSDFITDNGTAIDFDSCKMFWENVNVGNILSNSGDTLKLLVPNHSRKAMSGWSNYSGTVTSQKMCENKMGYRGSKSAFCAVKEQRVDGSRYIKMYTYVFKVYSNGRRKLLSNQKPF